MARDGGIKSPWRETGKRLIALALLGLMCGCGGAAEASGRKTDGSGGALSPGGERVEGSAEGGGSPGLTFPPLGERSPSTAIQTGVPTAGAGAPKVPLQSLPPTDDHLDRPAGLSMGTVGASRPTSSPSRSRAQASTHRGLQQSVERVVRSAARGAEKASKGKMTADQAMVAVMAQDLMTGDVLVQRLAGKSMMPASNLKVLTAAAALLGLGANAQFETRFESSGRISGGRLAGALVVRAGADPMHVREGDGSLDRWLDPLAADLKRAGIRKVKGPLVLDTTGFEKPGPALEWPSESAHWQAYCALSGGVNANGGVFRVTVELRGGSPNVTLRPRHHGLKRRGRVQVQGSKNALRVGANAGGVTVGGTVPSKMDLFVTEFRHPDPIQLFGEAILGGLEARGIAFENRSFVQGTGSGGEARLLHTMSSPLSSVLEAVLLDSNNAVTDQIFLLLGHRLGGEGTRAKAAAAVRRVLREAGVDASQVVQADGSGLSKANRLTAGVLVQTLTALARGPKEVRRQFLSSLPIAGSTGGLKNRMKGTAAAGVVAAKTGWVSGASSLSGFVLGPAGEPRIAFSILVGYPRIGGLNTSSWKPMQDEICALLAEELASRR